MDTTMMAGGLGFFGGVVVTAGGAAWTHLIVERNELRRLRVECVMNLVGARFVLDKKDPNPEDKARFNIELNKIPALFAEDDEVMAAYRAFAANASDTQKIHPVILALLKNVKIGKHVEYSDIETVLRA